MKEIIFKVWVPSKKMMTKALSIKEWTGVLFYRSGRSGRSGELVYLQDTCREDIHGKRIFVGDIISYPFKRRGKIQTCISVVKQSPYGYFYCDPNKTIVYDYASLIGPKEIIGNIYQNPDLVPEK